MYVSCLLVVAGRVGLQMQVFVETELHRTTARKLFAASLSDVADSRESLSSLRMRDIGNL